MYVYCGERFAHVECYSDCGERFAHVECYSDCSRKGSHLVENHAMVLFSVCSVVTVECCVLYPCCMGGLVCLLLCKEEGSSLVSITKRRDMGLYEVPLFVSLLGFGIGTMLANFHV